MKTMKLKSGFILPRKHSYIMKCIADWEKDGRYNHVAFVVASGSKISSGYDDVTIAQHTSNCCARVTSFVNGWGNTSVV